MRRTDPDAWLFVFFVVAVVVLPIVVGFFILKIYRAIKPIEISESASSFAKLEKQGDSFFKVLILGWVLCGPVFYYIFSTYMS